MNRYRKGIAAALGLLAQAALLLDEQLDAGTLPESWVPWARLIVAIATVVGVVWVKNAPAPGGSMPAAPGGSFPIASGGYIPQPPTGRGRDRRDAGTTRTVLVTLVGFALAGVLVIATMLAGPADAHRRTPLHVRTNGVQVCEGMLLVAFSLEELQRGVWTFRQDDGSAVIQLHHLGNGAAPGGQWETYVPASGGEGHLRLSVVGRPFWDSVRVVHAGIASSPRLPAECTA